MGQNNIKIIQIKGRQNIHMLPKHRLCIPIQNICKRRIYPMCKYTAYNLYAKYTNQTGGQWIYIQVHKWHFVFFSAQKFSIHSAQSYTRCRKKQYPCPRIHEKFRHWITNHAYASTSKSWWTKARDQIEVLFLAHINNPQYSSRSFFDIQSHSWDRTPEVSSRKLGHHIKHWNLLGLLPFTFFQTALGVRGVWNDLWELTT